MQHLTKLNLSRTAVTGKGLEQIGKIKHLRILLLKQCKVSGAINELQGTPILYLALNDVVMLPDDLTALVKMPQLHAVSLEGCPLTNADLIKLAANHNLAWVELSKCPFDR